MVEIAAYLIKIWTIIFKILEQYFHTHVDVPLKMTYGAIFHLRTEGYLLWFKPTKAKIKIVSVPAPPSSLPLPPSSTPIFTLIKNVLADAVAW